MEKLRNLLLVHELLLELLLLLHHTRYGRQLSCQSMAGNNDV